MDYSTYEQLVEKSGLKSEVEEKSLYRALEAVTDRRDKRGVRYSVALVLTLLRLWKLVGETKVSGIARLPPACEKGG